MSLSEFYHQSNIESCINANPARKQFYHNTPHIVKEIKKQCMKHGNIKQTSSRTVSVIHSASEKAMRSHEVYRIFPILDSTFDKLGESHAQIFLLLDLHSEFWQTKMRQIIHQYSLHTICMVFMNGFVYLWISKCID